MKTGNKNHSNNNTGWEDQYPTVGRGAKQSGDHDGGDQRQHNWGEHSTSDPRVSHRGKGPKGYKRTDSRIEEDINEALTDHPWLDSTNIDVSVVTGDVTLTGTVDTKQSKRLAEDIAESIPGVTNVENRLRTNSSASRSPSSDKGNDVKIKKRQTSDMDN